MMGESTTLNKASGNSQSLRITVPKGIVNQLNLKQGQKLYWEIQAKGNKLIIIVKPE